MVSLQTVEQQLKAVNCAIHWWGFTEVRELPNILMPGEVIAQCANGYYEGGFGMLCVTNHRLLLIDRKPMFLTTEDIRFDMVSEVDYYFGVIAATVRVMTPNQILKFSSWSQARLRKLATYAQHQVIQLRSGNHNQVSMSQQFQQSSSGRVQSNYQIDTTGWLPRRRTIPVRKIASLAMRAQGRMRQTILSTATGTGTYGAATKIPVNSYGKVPLLSRRRHFPPFHR